MDDLHFDALTDGPVDYLEAWERQRQVHAGVVDGGPARCAAARAPADVHRGKRTEDHERPQDGTPVIDVDRGGKITFHGPGQLVGYPIVRLADHVLVVDFVRRLEEALIGVCRDLGRRDRSRAGPQRRLAAGRAATATGPGRPERKIAAIGIRVSRG